MATAFKTVISVTTELGKINQLAASLKLESFPVYQSATINAKYGVNANASMADLIASQGLPTISYFGIGIGGFANISTDKNIAQPYTPSPSDMDLYTPIPFRCTKTPLDASELAKYRIVERRKINDQWYFLYWLKKLDFGSGITITKLSGEDIASGSLDTSNLFPVPKNLVSSEVDENTSRTSVSVAATRVIEGPEVMEAIDVMYDGDLRRARISEFGLYTGIENPGYRDENVLPSGTYTEAAYVQLASHMCCLGYDKSSPNTKITERCVISTGELVQL